MKKLIVFITAILSVGIVTGGVALAKNKTSYSLPASYKAVFCYPTGTYWQEQVNDFPHYYAVNNAYYAHLYGAGTIYC